MRNEFLKENSQGVMIEMLSPVQSINKSTLASFFYSHAIISYHNYLTGFLGWSKCVVSKMKKLKI